jgi:methylated-DNA-protein-cysteine methyltransferase related protein
MRWPLQFVGGKIPCRICRHSGERRTLVYPAAPVTAYDPSRHGPVRIVGPGFHARVHDLLRTVPAGAVTTYGDLAGALGARSVARQVGYALAALPAGSDVPWHRVVDGRGFVTRPGSVNAKRQSKLLRAEGVTIARDGRVADFAQRRYPFAGGV